MEEEAKEDSNIRYLIGKVTHFIYEMRIMAISVVAVGRRIMGMAQLGKWGTQMGLGWGVFNAFSTNEKA